MLAIDSVDAVFLDLPCPWLALPSALKILKSNGRFCSFSPCIEQVQRTCDLLRSLRFEDVTTIECLIRPYSVKAYDVASFGSDGTPERTFDRKRRRDSNNNNTKPTESGEVLSTNTTAPNITQTRVVTAAPVQEIRGHTGYLTFATKHVMTNGN